MKRFNIVLLIRHPNIDPNVISRELKLEPYASATAGDPRVALNGKKLSDKNRISSWSHIFHYKGEVNLSFELEQLIEFLYIKKDFFLRLASEGSDTSIFFDLPGVINQSCMAKLATLKLLIELEFQFGLEVFPDSPILYKQSVGITNKIVNH